MLSTTKTVCKEKVPGKVGLACQVAGGLQKFERGGFQGGSDEVPEVADGPKKFRRLRG